MAAVVMMRRRNEREEEENGLGGGDVLYSFRNPNDGPLDEDEDEDEEKDLELTVDERRHAEDLDILHKLCLKVRETQLKRGNYLMLGVFLLFVTIFMTVLYLQQQSFKTYETVSTHKQLLPDNTFEFANAGDIYDWINNTILQTIYTDPDCGNGICSYPEEFPGFGRFGCIADCGVLTNVTPVIIKFTTDFQSEDDQKESWWNLCLTSPTQLCWYMEPQRFSGPLISQTQDKVILPDGTWQIRITAPHGGVTGEVDLTDKVPDDKFALKTTTLTKWGSCKPRSESRLAQCRIACARFSVCGVMACRNLGEHAMAQYVVQCYAVCNESPESIISSYSNISCYAVACAINGTKSFLATSVGATVCIPEPLYDGRPPDGGIVTLPFDDDGLRITGFNNTPAPVGPQYCTDTSSSSSSSTGRRRLLDFSPWRSLFSAGSDKGVDSISTQAAPAPAAAPVDPSLNYTWPSVTPWEMLGPNDFARMTNLQVAVARALFTWPKTECTCPRRYYIDPEKNGARFVAFFCAYMGGPPDFPGCNYTHPVTGRQLTALTELNQAMGHVHDALGFEFAKDEVAVFLDIMVSSVQSVAALPPASLWEVSNHLRQVDFTLINTSLPVSCKTARTSLSWRAGVNHNSSIWNGSIVKWVWEDSNAHSIREVRLGSGPFAEFRGVGSGILSVDRTTVCGPTNSDYLPIDKLPPVPCNLVNVMSTSAESSGGFTYAWQFEKPGEYRYEDARFGSLMTGTVSVADRTQNLAALAALTGNVPVEIALCAPQCPLFLLNDGQCLEACNVQNCNFDGGDCTCFNPEFGTNTCTCFPGQVKNSDGVCCEPGTVGKELLFSFTLDQYSNDDGSSASFLPGAKHTKDRVFAFKNRLLVGMLIHQTRGTTKECSNHRFEKLHSKCLDRTPSVAPYGVDPVFLATSSLYNPDLDAQDFYAHQEYTPLGIPYGFLHQPVKGYPPGFTAIFDINLSNDDAQKRLSYLIDGYFIDNATRTLTVQLVTYNGNQQQFTDVEVQVEFQPGGKLAVTWSIDAVRMELYHTRTDIFRACLEAILFVSICYNLYGELKEWRDIWKASKRAFAYFDSFWNVIDLASLGLLFVSSILWITHYVTLIAPFKVVPRYDVYANVTSGARFWLLNNGGSEFEAAMSKLVRINGIMAFRSAYMALNGISMFLIMLRVLKFLDFQPRMGIITRSLSNAASELFNFFMLLGLLFITYSLMAHLVFGRLLDSYRTLAVSMVTNFNIVTGDNSVEAELLLLQGWELAAGQLFFWTFIIFIMFILMNFLIAIVVDAFADAKGNAETAPSMPSEVVDLVRDFVEGLLRGSISEKQLLAQLSAWSPTYDPPPMVAGSLGVRERSMFADLADRLKGSSMQHFCLPVPKGDVHQQGAHPHDEDMGFTHLDYATLEAILRRCSEGAARSAKLSAPNPSHTKDRHHDEGKSNNYDDEKDGRDDDEGTVDSSGSSKKKPRRRGASSKVAFMARWRKTKKPPAVVTPADASKSLFIRFGATPESARASTTAIPQRRIGRDANYLRGLLLKMEGSVTAMAGRLDAIESSQAFMETDVQDLLVANSADKAGLVDILSPSGSTK